MRLQKKFEVVKQDWRKETKKAAVVSTYEVTFICKSSTLSFQMNN